MLVFSYSCIHGIFISISVFSSDFIYVDIVGVINTVSVEELRLMASQVELELIVPC